MIINGDSLENLKTLEPNSIDSVVTDPPYGLAFMGKKWDYDVPSVELWREVLRVLKPGGHVLSFGGTRTYHRMVVNMEDAGFEIRDQLQWIYGSGFPKSHNLDGKHTGWGTALKPANEPIVLARKPLIGTVAANVERFGTGALNIDASRIQTSDVIPSVQNQNIRGHMIGSGDSGKERDTTYMQSAQGRWPANILFDEEAAAVLDDQSGVLKTGGASRFFYVAKASKKERNAGLEELPKVSKGHLASASGGGGGWSGDSQKNPNLPRQNFHPTVKPVKLMEYLVRMITPPGGTVLDPFMGSGTTGVAAKSLGFNFIGVELSPEYAEIAKRRIEATA